MKSRARRALALGAVPTLLAWALHAGAPVALAHVAPTSGTRSAIERSIVPLLVSPQQPAPGVTVRILPGRVTGVLIDASAAPWTVTVLGAHGEPAVRLGRRGTEVNTRSPSHAKPTLGASGAAGRVYPRAPARWRRISVEARYAWLEPRASYPARRVPRDVVAAGRPRTLSRWRIPLEIEGRRTDLQGVTRWAPVAELRARSGAAAILAGFAVPIAVLAALTVAALVGLVAVGRGRGLGPPRRRRPVHD